MKVCFVGMGSIGQRHLHNLIKVASDYGLKLELHVFRETDRKLEYDILSCFQKEFRSLDDLPDDYDIVFICNPTCKHYESLGSFIGKTKHMFIEKPIFSDLTVRIDLIPFKSGNVYYVASPLKFSPVIDYLKKNLDQYQVFSIRSICSSYLPDWRKGVDYRECYSAKKEMGGGVSLDLIHEWDYLKYLFGNPQEVYRISGKYSNLDIDSDDLAIYIARCTDKMIEIHLDYFGRQPERSISLYTDCDIIIGNILDNSVTFSIQNKTLKFQQRDIYLSEMSYFINLILNGGENINTVENALDTMRIAIGEGHE